MQMKKVPPWCLDVTGSAILIIPPQVAKQMGGVVKGMDRAMASMDLEQVRFSIDILPFLSPSLKTDGCADGWSHGQI